MISPSERVEGLSSKPMPSHYKVRHARRDVKVYLAQEFQKIDHRDGANHVALRASVDEVLEAGSDADLIVISELPREVADDRMAVFKRHAIEQRQFIVVGRGVGTYNGRTANEIGVYAPDGSESLQDKLSLSASDRKHVPSVVAGSELIVHESGHFRFVVLNCHDYTHASLIHDLVSLEVDVIVVVSANIATQMFIEYAKADVHRLFAYVVICNVAELGGSGVYAPFQSRHDGEGVVGEAPGSLSMGGVQFEARGRARARVEVDLAVPALRALREGYRQIDPDNPKSVRELPSIYRAIAPPENVTYSRPYFREVLRAGDRAVFDDIILPDPRREGRVGGGTWNVTVAQLRSSGLSSYLTTRYTVSGSPEGKRLATDIMRLLSSTPPAARASVAEQAAGNPLPSDLLPSYVPSDLTTCDLLVFPEVYLPIHALVDGDTLDSHVQRFADRHGTIVVGGIEYEPGSHEGMNRVRVYWPGHPSHDYLKLTRSQYDAREPPGPGDRVGAPFPLKRGQRILRFSAGESLSFGVLTCFDYSHLELVHALNTRGRPRRREPTSGDTTSEAMGPTPLDLVVVPCFNPYGALYADMARADAHRYYQYVIVCNVAEHGESGVFGPERKTRPRRTLIHAGKDVATLLHVTLPIGDLRTARDRTIDGQLAAESGQGRFHRKPGLLTDGERVPSSPTSPRP